jgi:hypothetical protein
VRVNCLAGVDALLGVRAGRYSPFIEVLPQRPFHEWRSRRKVEVDPERLKTPEHWKEFLRAKGIVYVVRAPNYPMVIDICGYPERQRRPGGTQRDLIERQLARRARSSHSWG